MLRTILVATVALFIGGCASSQNTPAAESGPPELEGRAYAPLKVGASWTYRVWFQGQEGTRTIKIVDARDGYYVDDAGGALKYTDSGVRDRSRYLIHHPLEVGTEWKAVLSASAVENYRIASVGEPCTVDAGRFNDCLVVEGSIKRDEKVTLHSTFTWAKGIGLARIQTEAEIAGQPERVPQTDQSLQAFALDGPGKKKKAAESEEAPDTWTK